MRTDVRIATALAAAVVGLTGCTAGSGSHARSGVDATVVGRQHLHYAANDNFTPSGRYVPGALGYDLADVSAASMMSKLPRGVRALVYIGSCGGATPAFKAAVRRFPSTSRVWGYYLVDEPQLGACPPSRLRAEADWVHQHRPNQKTFAVIENLSSSAHPTYVGGYTSRNTHVDYFGIDPYPCRTELHGCDLTMIDRYVNAAVAAGLPRRRLVPVYQAFGGGTYHDDGGGQWALPTARQARDLICRWARDLPNPVFDFVYSWGSQRNDQALNTASPALRRVFATHNANRLNC